MDEFVAGFDVGGSGARAALARLTGGRAVPVARATSPAPLRRGPRGIDGAATAAVVIGLFEELLSQHVDGGSVTAVAVGCAGAGLVGNDLRAKLPSALFRATGCRIVVISSDTVTSFLGGLGGEPGVMLAVGTGAVAIGSDLVGRWRRVDGWGPLVGDLGGGAWIGRAGLVAALRASDGRAQGSPSLLVELRRQFTDPTELIAALHDREDYAAVLASFAPTVLAAASAGDPVAAAIQAEACRHLADAAAAARLDSPGITPMVTLGTLLEVHDQFRAGVLAELPHDLRVRPAAGTACDGAVWLAGAAVAGQLPASVRELATLHVAAPDTDPADPSGGG